MRIKDFIDFSKWFIFNLSSFSSTLFELYFMNLNCFLPLLKLHLGLVDLIDDLWPNMIFDFKVYCISSYFLFNLSLIDQNYMIYVFAKFWVFTNAPLWADMRSILVQRLSWFSDFRSISDDWMSFLWWCLIDSRSISLMVLCLDCRLIWWFDCNVFAWIP